MKKLLLLLILSLLFVTSSFATTYYVKIGGSDGAAGTSWATAWATISKINATLAGGDTVYFGTGTWRGQIAPVSGTTSDRTCYACSSFVQGIAHIWGSDSISSWVQHSGNVYKARWVSSGCFEPYGYEPGDAGYICGQISPGVDTVLIPSTAIPTSAGHFYYDTSKDTIYVWLVGGGDPTGKDIEPSCHPAVLFGDNQDYCTFWGFDLRYGKLGTVVIYSDACDYNYFDHCNITRAGYVNQENVSAFFTIRTDYVNGEGNRLRACTLGVAVDPNMDDWRFGVGVYTQNHFVVESCYVMSGVNEGIDYKENTYGCVMRFNTINMSTGSMPLMTHNIASYDSIYGNTVIGGYDTGPWVGIGAWGLSDCSNHFICNNTIYRVYSAGIIIGLEGTFTSPNYYKYNITHTIYDIDNMDYTAGFIHILNNNQTHWTIDSNLYYNSDTAFAISWSEISLTNWRNTYGFDVHSVFYDPGFNNPAGGDFSRPSSSQEMNVTYGGKTWTRFGAWQPEDTTGVGDSLYHRLIIKELLLGNYPNPFNSNTTITYNVDSPTQVDLSIYNLGGKKVKTLLREFQYEGIKKITWDGKDDKGKFLPSGIYFSLLAVGKKKQTLKLTLLK
jgi:hypothetical protein